MNVYEILTENAQSPIEEISFTRDQWTNIFFNLQRERVANAWDLRERSRMVDQFIRDISASFSDANLKARLVRYGANLGSNIRTYSEIESALQPLTADVDLPVGSPGVDEPTPTGPSVATGGRETAVRQLIPNAPEQFNSVDQLNTFLRDIGHRMFGDERRDTSFAEEGWKDMVVAGMGGENPTPGPILRQWQETKNQLRTRLSQNRIISLEDVYRAIAGWVVMADVAYRGIRRAQ